MKETDSEKEVLGFRSLLILVLSCYILLALLIDTFFNLPGEISEMLHLIDNAICIVFLYDFVVRFNRATNKMQFMKWGWIDLVSSIPTFDFMRAGRLLRLIRIIRLIRAFRSAKQIAQHIFKDKAKGALTSVSLIAVLVLLLSSIAILEVENAPNSNIKTAEDAIWWSYTTITTVGYGDRYPVTTEGRFIAAVLMTVGVGIFGTFTAYVSSLFVSQKSQEKKDQSL